MTDDLRGWSAPPAQLPSYGTLLSEGWSRYFAVFPQWSAVGLPVLGVIALVHIVTADLSLGARVALSVPLSLLSALSGCALEWLVWSDLHGEDIGTAEAWRRAASRVGIVWVVSFALMLMVFAGALLLLLPGLWVAVRLLFSATAANLTPEEGSPFPASYQLTAGRTWWVAGLVLMLGVVACVLAIPVVLIKAGNDNPVAQAVENIVMALVLGPFSTTVVGAYAALLGHRDALAAPPAYADARFTGFVPPAPQAPNPEAAAPPAAPDGGSTESGPDAGPRPAGDDELPRGGAAAPFE